MPMLAACFGVDVLFKRLSVSFPASVACLVLLFLGLLACEAVLGGHRTRRVVSIIDVPVSLCLCENPYIKSLRSPPLSVGNVMRTKGIKYVRNNIYLCV